MAQKRKSDATLEINLGLMEDLGIGIGYIGEKFSYSTEICANLIGEGKFKLQIYLFFVSNITYYMYIHVYTIHTTPLTYKLKEYL